MIITRNMKHTNGTETPDVPTQNTPAPTGPSGPTNQKEEFGLDDIAASKCYEVTCRQDSDSTRNAGFQSTERVRELRRMLVRNKL